jgi:hypothetical protein
MMRTPAMMMVAGSLMVCACSGTSNDGEDDDSVTSRSTATFDFDASKGALPRGTSFAFSDYPASEDDEAASPARVRFLKSVEDRVNAVLGRPALLSEIVEEEEKLHLDIHGQGGFWFNTRFEKVTAKDAAPAFVMTQINRSDDTDTNLLFDFEALKKRARYKVEAMLVLRTNAPVGCSGVGGSPDGVVYTLAFSTTPWVRGRDSNDHFRMTNRASPKKPTDFDTRDPAKLALENGMDLGSIGAPHATNCGTFTNNPFEDVTHTSSGVLETDDSGVLHVNLSTHSGFEGLSLWAVKSVKITLAKQ